MESVRKFEFRPSRMKTGFNVDLMTEGQTLHGICRDLSDTGIRAEFDGLVVVGNSGILILRHRSDVLNIETRVAYIEKSQVGLVFLFKTPLERAMTTQFIAAIANYKSRSGSK